MALMENLIYGPSISRHPDNGWSVFRFIRRNTTLRLRVNEKTGEWDLYSKVDRDGGVLTDEQMIARGTILDGHVWWVSSQ